MNATNYDLIAAALSEADTDKWPGRVVELYPSETTFGGKTMACVRVRRHRKPSTPAPEINPPSADDEADEISWSI
jgi:hypothetical protein